MTKKHDAMEGDVIYQIRDKEGKALGQFDSLLRARIASVDIKQGKEIIELSFIDGEWEGRGMYVRLKDHPCYKGDAKGGVG